MHHSTYVPVPSVLATAQHINAYDEAGLALKEDFHKQGQVFLKGLAMALGLVAGTYEVRSNKGGIAVSGEVTLHSEDIYLQLSESSTGPGVQVLYRTCNGRKDYCGHQNRFARMDAFVGEDKQAEMTSTLRTLIEREHQRKVDYASANQLPFSAA